jgi:hypothetical protein
MVQAALKYIFGLRVLTGRHACNQFRRELHHELERAVGLADDPFRTVR